MLTPVSVLVALTPPAPTTAPAGIVISVAYRRLPIAFAPAHASFADSVKAAVVVEVASGTQHQTYHVTVTLTWR